MPFSPFVAAVMDLTLPVRCAVCRGSDGPICRACAGDVRRGRARGRGTQVHPHPCPPGFPPTWAVGRLDGELRRLITGYKDGGRRDLAPTLGGLLAAAVAAALEESNLDEAAGRGALLVPVPTRASARRHRGDAPMTTLAYAAADLLDRADVTVAEVLVPGRRTRDQAHLTQEDRARNLAGAWEVPTRWQGALGGRRVVIVDDIVTSGATLVESARAITQARARAAPVVAAVIAATVRRGGASWSSAT